MIFPNLKAGDKVIGVYDFGGSHKRYYNLYVTKITPTRFLTDCGMSFLHSTGRRWGAKTVIKAERAIPYTKELWNEAIKQNQEQRKKNAREKLISTIYTKCNDVRRYHLEKHSDAKLYQALEVIENLINPKPIPEPSECPDDTVEETQEPSSEEIAQRLKYEDSFI